MAKNRDEETGEYTEAYPSNNFISVLRELGGAAGTQEVADKVGCAYRTAHAKLTQLENEGQISSRQVGNAKLWQLSE